MRTHARPATGHTGGDDVRHDHDERGTRRRRRLTQAEERRLRRFERVAADLQAQGYERVELTVGLLQANIFALALAVPLCVGATFAFMLLHPDVTLLFDLRPPQLAADLAILFALVVTHELIHGVTWGRFARGGLRDVEFGFVARYLSPYCTCTTPLPRRAYLLGGLMPLIVLGLVPLCVALVAGSPPLLAVGVLMTLAAGGDMLVVLRVLAHRTDAVESVVYDHPTQAGCVVFER